MKRAQGEYEDGIPFVDRIKTMISAFVNENNILAAVQFESSYVGERVDGSKYVKKYLDIKAEGRCASICVTDESNA